MEAKKTQEFEYTVEPNLLANAMGSGDMPVLATPAMVAMMENASMRLVAPELQEGETTVGSMISTSHLKPSAEGAKIVVSATLTEIDGRKLTFKVVAKDGETVIGEADHIRYIVGRERFLSKVYPGK